MTKTQLVALLRKYQQLGDLRAGREVLAARGEGWTAEEGIARRASFRQLAAAFPGALRELEISPHARLAAKARAVEDEIARVDAGGTVARRWVPVVLDFHATLARALAVKRWLARGGDPAPPVAEIEALRRPPGGRLVTWVWLQLERRHGLPRAALEDMVFGAQD